MKKIISNIFTWIYVQLYVSFAVIFLKKSYLLDIARKTGNHPLIIYHSSRWMRIWWLAWALIVVWGFFAWPLLSVIIGVGPTTSYSEITHQDMVIFFNKYTLYFWNYWLAVVVSGKLLTLFEITVYNKMNYFRSYVSLINPNQIFKKQNIKLKRIN